MEDDREKLMIFHNIDSVAEPAEFLADKINRALGEGRKILWLIPGGSAIAVAVAALKLLDRSNLNNLTATLTDERYGPVGHADSNSQQLQEAGFEPGRVNFLPVLDGKPPEATAFDFANQIQRNFETNDFKIGLFGIGADGHIAGIKPGSPAVTSLKPVEYFYGDDFKRITITPSVIARLDTAVVYAVGAEKHLQLDRLQTELSVAEQPAQILKSVADLTVFSDHPVPS